MVAKMVAPTPMVEVHRQQTLRITTTHTRLQRGLDTRKRVAPLAQDLGRSVVPVFDTAPSVSAVEAVHRVDFEGRLAVPEVSATAGCVEVDVHRATLCLAVASPVVQRCEHRNCETHAQDARTRVHVRTLVVCPRKTGVR